MGAKGRVGVKGEFRKETGVQCQRPISLAPCLEAGGWIGLLETLRSEQTNNPFITVPVAKSSWTLITSNSLLWCIYFLILPGGKAVGLFVSLIGEVHLLA